MYVDVILFVMCTENHTICNVYINFTQTMFGSCLRTHVLFTLIVFVCAQWCPTYIVLCFWFVLFRLVYPKLSVSLDCHFWIALWYSLTFSYRRLTFSLNCIWTPTFSSKHKNLASVVWRFVPLLFFFGPLYFLSFFDVRLQLPFDIFLLLHMHDLLYW